MLFTALDPFLNAVLKRRTTKKVSKRKRERGRERDGQGLTKWLLESPYLLFLLLCVNWVASANAHACIRNDQLPTLMSRLAKLQSQDASALVLNEWVKCDCLVWLPGCVIAIGQQSLLLLLLLKSKKAHVFWGYWKSAWFKKQKQKPFLFCSAKKHVRFLAIISSSSTQWNPLSMKSKKIISRCSSWQQENVNTGLMLPKQQLLLGFW